MLSLSAIRTLAARFHSRALSSPSPAGLPRRSLLQVSGYSSGTVTFATPIAGAGRTSIQYAVGPSASTSVAYFSPFAQPVYSAIINGRFEGSETYIAPNSNDSPGIPCPSISNVYLNCTFVEDWSPVSSPNVPRIRTAFSATSPTSSLNAYNCRFHWRAAGRDTVGLTYTALKYDAPSLGKVANSIFTAEYAEGGSTPGVGNEPLLQVNNAYSGMTVKTGAVGYDQDPYLIEIGNMPTFGHPESASALLSSHSQLVLGQYSLQYDADWQPRSTTTPAIGPYEPLASP